MYFRVMKAQIDKLQHISQKSERLIIGLMSGTSLDGLDIACCRIKGSGPETEAQLENFITVPYEPFFQEQVREVFAKRTIDQQVLCGLNAYIGNIHGEMINYALELWNMQPETIDLIASHGQTVYHAPQSFTQDDRYPNSTLQIGDADHIAVKTGIITLADFRQKHLAAGGEGAPLAAYGDFLLFTDEDENRVLLNIGGISNFTLLPRRNSHTEAYATDLGPGNTLMNQYMYQEFKLEMDKHAQLAKSGQVHKALLAALLDESFLAAAFPKTTGPERYNLAYLAAAQSRAQAKDLTPADIMATLNCFAAQAIVEGIKRATAGMDNVVVYISGGGLHNPLLVENIRQGLKNEKVCSFEALGMNPDAKEACLFAVLANETLAGRDNGLAGVKGSPRACMGKISLPY